VSRAGTAPAAPDETIAAIATPPGRGAVAIVRISGPRAAQIGARVFRGRATFADRVAEYGRIVDADGATVDRGLALFFRAPRSYTGEDVLELHVHGSPAVARDVLLATLEAGARLATPGEFTRRAFLAGKLDLCAAEAVADLIAAEARGAARAAAARLSGGLAAEVERGRAVLDDIAAELSAAIDYPQEVPAPERVTVAARLRELDAALADLGTTWERGRLVREGPAVAIVGPPNAGKSSLLNALLGADRALVSELAGTTRDTIEETLSLGDGVVARVIDTAGLRPSGDPVEAAGVARAEAALAEASVALVVVDGSRPVPPEVRELLVRTRARPRVAFFNKADLGDAGYRDRDAAELSALLGSAHDRGSVEVVRRALHAHAVTDRVDVTRPHLGTARQADAVLTARASLRLALETLESGDPIDLVAGDVCEARAALGELTGRDASESLLDGIFARFCVGK
jgi:tRNA modification GTPase